MSESVTTFAVPEGRVPPHNLEAEQSVLGAILLDHEALHRAMEVLRPEDFYREAHRRIFEAMIALQERAEPIDLITLTEYLRQQSLLELVGGASYLATLAAFVPSSAHVRHHARIIRQKAIQRNLIQVATEILTRCYEDQQDVEVLLDQAENAIFSVAEQKVVPTFVSLRELIKGTFETIESLYERKERVTGIPTGYVDLDEQTSGLQPGDLIVVAGRPSMGKTAFALGIAQHVGIECRLPVALFSLEMSKEQLALRMLCSEARVDAHRLRRGYLSRSDWPRLTIAAGRLAEAPIFIDDTPGLSVLEMKARARRLKSEHGLALVLVDYLQLMRGRGRAENREQEISEISRSLKALAKELHVPVVALSQLNRAVESRQDKRPQLADLRESGSIEQDADVVLFIYREEVYRRDVPEVKGIAEVIIGKQRNGPVGTVKLAFLDQYTRFENLDRIHPDGEE